MGQTISELIFTRPFHHECLELTVIKKKKINQGNYFPTYTLNKNNYEKNLFVHFLPILVRVNSHSTFKSIQPISTKFKRWQESQKIIKLQVHWNYSCVEERRNKLASPVRERQDELGCYRLYLSTANLDINIYWFLYSGVGAAIVFSNGEGKGSRKKKPDSMSAV